MRQLGVLLIVGGIAAYFYCGQELTRAPAMPEGLTARETLDYPAGRLEAGRFAGAAAAGIGVLLALGSRR